MSAVPRISVGMPAYTAATTLGASIESWLAQSFTDFELIVSDNASTDATREVVESYRRRDPRIRYERQPINVGANANYSHVARLASGEFFKWASANDLCAPTFLERCLAELVAHDDAVLRAAPGRGCRAGEPPAPLRRPGRPSAIGYRPSALRHQVLLRHVPSSRLAHQPELVHADDRVVP